MNDTTPASYDTLGVLGGMGPFASAEFLKTIYEYNCWAAAEQEYPNVILHSITSIPDRTGCLLSHKERHLEQNLRKNLETLCKSGVKRIVMCCVTSHYLLPAMPQEIIRKVVSLIDITARDLIKHREPSLLLATQGSYQKKIFETGPLGDDASPYLVVPDTCDQAIIQQLIYSRLKPKGDTADIFPEVRSMLNKYGLQSFISGCTEFHLLVKYLLSDTPQNVRFIDPLLIIAKHFREVMNGTYE